MKRTILLLSAALWFACTPMPPKREAEAPAPLEQPKEFPAAPAAEKEASSPLPTPAAEKAAKKPGRTAAPYTYTLVDSASMGNEIVLTSDKLLPDSRGPEGDSGLDKSVGDAAPGPSGYLWAASDRLRRSER